MIFNLNQQISRIHLRIFRFVLLCGVMFKKKNDYIQNAVKEMEKMETKILFLFI